MDDLKKIFPRANGFLPLDLGWRGAFTKITIVGGPYDFYPGPVKAFGVCVRAEPTKKPIDAHLPIEDFSVPHNPSQVEAVLRQAFRAALRGRTVYVGCMGGWGRTGLFLALMAKVVGVPDPIGYVRMHYSCRAVETESQMHFVEDFDVTEIRKWLYRHAWLRRVAWLDRIFDWPRGY